MKPQSAWPHPVLSLLVAATWLLLQQSLAVPQLLSAALLAWGLPRLLHGFLGPTLRLRRWALVLPFAGRVLGDIVRANIVVARLVLSPSAVPRPAWVWVALDSTEPSVVSLLAIVITMTPGTVSCVVDEARGGILVHALDCEDPVAAAADMKARYERPLMEMFEP